MHIQNFNWILKKKVEKNHTWWLTRTTGDKVGGGVIGGGWGRAGEQQGPGQQLQQPPQQWEMKATSSKGQASNPDNRQGGEWRWRRQQAGGTVRPTSRRLSKWAARGSVETWEDERIESLRTGNLERGREAKHRNLGISRVHTKTARVSPRHGPCPKIKNG